MRSINKKWRKLNGYNRLLEIIHRVKFRYVIKHEIKVA